MRPQSSPGDMQALRPGPGPTRAEAPFVSHGRELLSGARIPPNGKQRPLRCQRGEPLGLTPVVWLCARDTLGRCFHTAHSHALVIEASDGSAASGFSFFVLQ